MRTIEVNVLSKKSINDAIKELKDYQKEIENKKNKFVRVVAEKLADRIAERYHMVNNPNVENAGLSVVPTVAYGRAVITAHGIGLFFIEFGTGTLASSTKGWSYGFIPGSWSVEHKDTWTKWLEGDQSEPYPYSYEAADAFLLAIVKLDDIVAEAADEVFK